MTRVLAEEDHLVCCRWDVAVCGLNVGNDIEYESVRVPTATDSCTHCLFTISDPRWTCPDCGCGWGDTCIRHV